MTKKTIMEYSDFKNPFLKVTVFDGSGQKQELLIKFSDYELENGEIVDTNSVVTQIRNAFDRIYPVELLLSCEEIYKSVFSLPKTSRFRAESAYRRELKEMQRDDYTVITDFYVHSVGYVYNSYFVPNKIINCLKKIVRELNTRVDAVRLFGMYLKEQLNYKHDYVYFYIRESLCRMLLVVENRLVTEYDFVFNSVEDIKRRFLMVASKHEFEFERKKIAYYGIDSDIPLELSGLKRVDVEEALPSDGIEIEYDDDPLEEMTNLRPTTFEERLADCPEYVRKRYQTLLELICSYQGMQCQISEVCATFHVMGKVWFKMDIDRKGQGKRVSLYIADDPIKFALRKVQFAISKKQNYLSTPCLIRISTNMRFSLAKQLIKKYMAENNIPLAKSDEKIDKKIKKVNLPARSEQQASKEQLGSNEVSASEANVAETTSSNEVATSAVAMGDAMEDAIQSDAPSANVLLQEDASKQNKVTSASEVESADTTDAADMTENSAKSVAEPPKKKGGWFGRNRQDKAEAKAQKVAAAKEKAEKINAQKAQEQKAKEQAKLEKAQIEEKEKTQKELSKEQTSKAKPANKENKEKQRAQEAQRKKAAKEKAQREKVQQALNAKNQKTQAALKEQKGSQKKK